MNGQFNEADWKVFRKKLPEWQEAYMEHLNQEYVALLSGAGTAADKFWELDKRIREDRKSPGVIVDMRRSMMYNNIMNLLSDGVITLDDLDGFSAELRQRMAYILGSLIGIEDHVTVIRE